MMELFTVILLLCYCQLTVCTQAETPLDIADEDVLDMMKEYYDRRPPRSKPIVPGVEKFLNPVLPDAKAIIPITKGSRKLRDKENRPEKLPKPIIETPKKEEPKNEVLISLKFLIIMFL